jgi:hypothetical protein
MTSQNSIQGVGGESKSATVSYQPVTCLRGVPSTVSDGSIARAWALIRVAAICIVGMTIAHQPACAQTTTGFNHNGSQVDYVVNGDRALISYAVPRAGLGVVPGVTLFEGRVARSGLVRGTAYAFSRGCPPAPYQVQGTLGETLVLAGAAPQRGANCAIVGYRNDLPAARLVFRAVSGPFASATIRSPAAALPQTPAAIVLKYTVGVGGPHDTSTPMKQALNEAMPRHIYLTRLPGDDREMRVAWRVRAMEGDPYPAQPNLFGSDTYPSGSVIMMRGALTSDVGIRTVRTDRPDWTRDFEVVLTDEATGQPILSPYHAPIAVAFSVAGDLKCKIGRADRCDPSRTLPVEDVPTESVAPTSARALLSAFCAPEDIRGSECLRAKNYHRNEACNVKFTGKSYTGRFIASSGKIVVADYQSDCEPHATDFGGSVLFEQTSDGLTFIGFEPGHRTNECVVASTNVEYDRLVCILSFNGQGQVDSSISELVFARQTSKGILISYNHFAHASSNSAAYGLDRVACDRNGDVENLAWSKLGPGPTAGTITAELEYADAATVEAACASVGSATNEALVPGSARNAFLLQGAERHRRIVVDLMNRGMVSMNELKSVH